MALTNTQYNRIMHSYGQRQLKNHQLTTEKREKIYNRLPDLKRIEDEITGLYARLARLRLTERQLPKTTTNSIQTLANASGQVRKASPPADHDARKQLEEELFRLKESKCALLEAAGLSEKDLEPVYTCPDCKDTGYIGSEPCHCFKQAAINEIYQQSHLQNILLRENFSNFSFDYYSDRDIDPATGISSLDTARRAVAECRRFVDNFRDKPKNLLFYGNTGVGKTFLSNCVAKELLDEGKSVIYFTSFQLFDILSKGIFEKDAEAIETNRGIFDCDLLIIDDLGTETPNSFTTSQLFLCVNERILRQKSTVISTNLNIRQLTEIYSERTLSRVFSNYSIIRMFGEDIRTKQRTRKVSAI